MEDIFKDTQTEEKETYNKIVSLKADGMSWRKIGEDLNKPFSSLRVIYDKYKALQECAESVQNDKNGSVADHLIEYIKENCITNKELEKLKIDIENLVNKRLNHGLKQIKEEIKNGLNA